MNSSKILLVLALIACCCLTLTYSLKCFTCSTKKECDRPKSNDCTPLLANNTRSFIDFHHKGVNMNATSPYFECYREYIKSVNGEFYGKGCIYSNIKGCQLQLHDRHTSGKYENRCYQCNDRNGCNPADRVNVNAFIMLAMAATVVVGKYVWSN